MKIEVPIELGKLINRTIDGNNIVFAADNHSSIGALSNNFNLYLHLVENYNVKVVGIESFPYHKVIDQKNADADITVVKNLLSNLDTLMSIDEHFANLGFLIQSSAYTLGKRLVIPDSGESIYTNILQKLILAVQNQDCNGDQSRIKEMNEELECLFRNHPLKSKLFSILPNLLTEVSPEQINDVYMLTSPIRTNALVSAVVNEMKNENTNIALIPRGVNHVGEFIEEVTAHEVGYAIFIPKGIEAIDPKMHTIYTKSLLGQ